MAIKYCNVHTHSRLCRDEIVALPIALDKPARVALAKDFSTEIAKRYRTISYWAVHRPAEGDKCNHHVHIRRPWRPVRTPKGARSAASP